MKPKTLLLASLTALLAACSGPTTGTGNNPGNTTPTPPPSAYPYNPNASAVPSNDARVPYYGDWVWAVAFSDNSTIAGVMSISVKGSNSATTFNVGGGVAAVCASDGSSCPVLDDIGAVGTGVVNGQARLTVAQGTQAGTLRWAGLDNDGVVGTEVKGKPTLTGAGAWNTASGTPLAVGFAMTQVSTTPSVTPKASSLPSAAGLAALSQLHTPLSAQQMNSMQARAVAAASALADGR